MGLRPLVRFKHQEPEMWCFNTETDGKFAALIACITSNAFIGAHVYDGVLHCSVLPCFDVYIIHNYQIDCNSYLC